MRDLETVRIGTTDGIVPHRLLVGRLAPAREEPGPPLGKGQLSHLNPDPSYSIGAQAQGEIRIRSAPS